MVVAGRICLAGVLVAVCCCACLGAMGRPVDPNAFAAALEQVRFEQEAQVPAAKDLKAASEAFMAWQAEVFRQRQEMSRRYSRLLSRRVEVPPPVPSSAEPPYMIRLDVPMPFPSDLQLSMSVGEPTASFAIRAGSKLLSVIGASYKAGVGYCASDNKWLVADAAELEVGVKSGGLELAWVSQFYSSSWSQRESSGAGLQLATDLYKVKGAIGYDGDGQLTTAVGYELLGTPKALSRLASASLELSAEVFAPVKVHGLTRSKRTLPSSIMEYSARLAKYLTGQVDCPHCGARGRLDCASCSNRGQIVCPKCPGNKEVTCTRCNGGGMLVCSTCRGSGWVDCSACGGSGQARCGVCGGSGHVTTYQSETRSRQVRKLISAGFDENGQPFEQWGYQTEYYTVEVPVSQTCSACGGSGRVGTCSACGGSGKVRCRTCEGSGQVYCSRCGGSGKTQCSSCKGKGGVTCPDYGGKTLTCPLCKGKAHLGD
ncbi:MAG: hypothetical protein QHH07_06565 [Sedimentisphaerales bacterium]|nr:hypothetical protein [Sedimentisphaerales bacterium]